MENVIHTAKIDDFLLDPLNPRLGRNFDSSSSQPSILKQMLNWSLEELAVSFLESGFWPQEALLCIEENGKLIVIEGNRRLATIKYLKLSFEGTPPNAEWAILIDGQEYPNELFESIPYLKLGSRDEVDSFLGFRHVTGIKQWAPAEKAQFIAHLIDDKGLTYSEVAKRIGSKLDAIRRNYITYKLLLQMEGTDGIDLDNVEKKFSVLSLAVRSGGIQGFLSINARAEPNETQNPVPEQKLENLKDFSIWLFGNGKTPPLVSDSRYIDKFSKMLESSDAIKYLRSSNNPSFDFAYKISGGEESETSELLTNAIFSMEQSLSSLYLHKQSSEIIAQVKRLLAVSKAIEEIFAPTFKV